MKGLFCTYLLLLGVSLAEAHTCRPIYRPIVYADFDEYLFDGIVTDYVSADLPWKDWDGKIVKGWGLQIKVNNILYTPRQVDTVEVYLYGSVCEKAPNSLTYLHRNFAIGDSIGVVAAPATLLHPEASSVHLQLDTQSLYHAVSKQPERSHEILLMAALHSLASHIDNYGPEMYRRPLLISMLYPRPALGPQLWYLKVEHLMYLRIRYGGRHHPYILHELAKLDESKIEEEQKNQLRETYRSLLPKPGKNDDAFRQIVAYYLRSPNEVALLEQELIRRQLPSVWTVNTSN